MANPDKPYGKTDGSKRGKEDPNGTPAQKEQAWRRKVQGPQK